MMIRNWKFFMLSWGCFSFITASSFAVYSPKLGQMHPDFVLPDISSNEPVSLSQFRGKKILLIHFASW